MTDQKGFVLPAIVMGLVIMSTMAIAMLLTSSDENRSAQATRQGSNAFYAAEAGLNAVFANWDTTFQQQIDSIAPGDSLELDWTTLLGGARYKAVIHRWDNGGSTSYELTVRGRGAGALSGQRTLSYMLKGRNGGQGSHYRLGSCCDAAVTMRGATNLDDDIMIDGHDANPAGWDSTTCPNELYDKPGLVMQDTTLLDAETSTTITGEPGVMQDASINDATFEQFGDLTWDSIAAMAEKTFVDTEPTPRPSTTIDPVTGELVCDYDDPLNLGSPDPNHPCFDYFPIVLIRDEVHFDGTGGYAQGIFVLDLTSANLGSEFDIEDEMVFNGIVLGKGCVEVQDNARYHGAMFVDGQYAGSSICNTDVPFDMHRDDATLRYSTCVIDRALVHSGLDEYAEAQVSGGSDGVSLLISRSFGEWAY